MQKKIFLFILVFSIQYSIAQVFEQNPERVYVYKIVEGKKIFFQWHQYTYTVDGKIATRVSSKKGATDSLEKWIYSYDKQGNLKEYSHWNYYNNNWLLMRGNRSVFVAHYITSLGDSLPLIAIAENFENNKWVPKVRFEYQYDLNNNPVLIRKFELDFGQPAFESSKDSLIYNNSGDSLLEWFIYEISSRGLVLTQKYNNIIGKYKGTDADFTRFNRFEFDVDRWRLVQTINTLYTDSLGSTIQISWNIFNDTLVPANRVTRKLHPETLATEWYLLENGFNSGDFRFSLGNFYTYQFKKGKINSVLVHTLNANMQPLPPFEEYIYNPDFSADLIEIKHDFGLIAYPNPACKLVFLEGQIEDHSLIEITDISGNNILNWEYSADGLDVSSLDSGLYFMYVKSIQGLVKPIKFFKL